MTNLLKKCTFVAILAGQCTFASTFKSIAKRNGIDNLELVLQTKLENFESFLDKSNINQTLLLMDTKIKIADDLEFHGLGGFKFETGNASSTYDQNRNTPKSSTIYNHGYIQYSPFALINVKAGALDNSSFEASSRFVNHNLTSLGLREEIIISGKKHSLIINATQATPYNDQLTDKIGIKDEGTPRFYSESLTSKNIFSFATLNLQASHYAYEQLSSSVAYHDQFYGNSVTGTKESNASYIYSFKGWTYAVEAIFDLGYLKISPSLEAINNDSASRGNSGKASSLALKTNIRSHLLTGIVTYFNNESDTAPSFYNNSPFKNNYKGNIYELELENTKNLKTNISYINRKVIDSSIFLANEKIIQISLRKVYDIF